MTGQKQRAIALTLRAFPATLLIVLVGMTIAAFSAKTLAPAAPNHTVQLHSFAPAAGRTGSVGKTYRANGVAGNQRVALP